MNYSDLIKRAFDLTFKNKFLWIFGLFVGTTSLGGLSSGGFEEKQFTDTVNITRDQLLTFCNDYAFLLLLGALILILVAIVMFVLALISQGALIDGADKLAKGEKSNFSLAFRVGKKYFWHLWAVAIIYSLVGTASLMFIAIPIVMTVFFVGFLPIALLWLLLTVPLVLIANIAASMILPFVYRVMIIENKGIKESIVSAFNLFKKKFIDLIVVNLVLLASSLVFCVVAFVVIFVVALILTLIGAIVWSASSAIGIVFAFIAVAGLIVLLIALAAGFSAFQSVVVTLAYNKLKP